MEFDAPWPVMKELHLLSGRHKLQSNNKGAFRLDPSPSEFYNEQREARTEEMMKDDPERTEKLNDLRENVLKFLTFKAENKINEAKVWEFV